MALHPSYECQCHIPRPLIVDDEDSGLCAACSYVYDPRLYEMRLRQHVEGFRWGSLDEMLIEIDPAYRRLAEQRRSA